MECPAYQNMIFEVQAKRDDAVYIEGLSGGPLTPAPDGVAWSASGEIADLVREEIEQMSEVLLLVNMKKIKSEEKNHEQFQLDKRAALSGKFRGPEFFTYLLDKLVWCTLQGSRSYLTVVHNGGYLATIVANAIVLALRKPAPEFPPWHKSHHQKYLVNEH